MRIDKFLKNSRLIKRRTVSKQACQAGRILINDKIAKPGSLVKVGDILTIRFGNREERVKILDLTEPVPKDKAQTLYEILS